ncbi:CpaB family protein [Wukongibacter baidiensis]
MEKSKKSGILFIFLAFILALGATGLSYAAINKITKKVPMMVASKDIEAGDPLNKDMFQVISVPIGGRPSDAIIPTKELDLSSYVALKDMSAKDILRKANIINLNSKDLPILSARLRSLDPKAINDLSYDSEELRSLRAAEIPVTSIIGMIPGMKTGDQIAITSVYIDEVDEGNKIKKVRKTETIFDFISVIGIKKPDDNSKGSLVIALSQRQFEAYSLAREKGKFYVALMPYGVKRPDGHPQILSDEYIKMLDLYEEAPTLETLENEEDKNN